MVTARRFKFLPAVGQGAVGIMIAWIALASDVLWQRVAGVVILLSGAAVVLQLYRDRRRRRRKPEGGTGASA